MSEQPVCSYWDYIRVEELLALQGGLEKDEASLGNDEVVFIVVHQVFELWFKLAIRELITARDLLNRSPVPDQEMSTACRGLKRVAEIFQLAPDHFRLMETLTTRDYLSFRDKLFPASGFQSAQMREMEIALGLIEEERIPFGPGGSYLRALEGADGAVSPALERVKVRLADRPSLREVLDDWLYRTPINASAPTDEGDKAVVDAFLAAYLKGHERSVERQLEAARSRGLVGEELAALGARFQVTLDGARAFLEAHGVPEQERERRRRIRAATLFIESYRELPLLAWPREVLDTAIEVEQRFLIFRQRHARMVERIIGRRVGTGGSAGVAYLDETALEYRIFKDLWAVRTLLLDVELLPKVQNPERYGFTGPA